MSEPHTHYVIACSCGTIAAQCRCRSASKVRTIKKNACPDCQAKTAAVSKQSGDITIYLVEEIGDARLRCSQLKKYVKEALDLVEKSEKRDHFFEIAAHLIHGIPDTLFRLDKALDAAAMAAARMDYEEVKQSLKPEKSDELDDVLPNVRMRHLQRRSIDEETKMTPKQAAEELLAIADETESTGSVPLVKVMQLLAAVEPRAIRASVPGKEAASVLRQIAHAMVAPNPSRSKLTASLRRVLADGMTATPSQVAASIYQTASSREDVMKGFAKANPHMSDEALEKAADMWERHKDVVKDKSANQEEDAHYARFPEGKPADPTEGMSPEDAKEWKRQNLENKDNFKSATSDSDQKLGYKPNSASVGNAKLSDLGSFLGDTFIRVQRGGPLSRIGK